MTANDRPRALYVTLFSPFEATIGAQMRSLHVLRALQELARVEVVIIQGSGQNGEVAPELSSEFEIADVLEVKPRAKGLGEKFAWGFNPWSSYPNGCGVDEDSFRRLHGRLSEFDLIWFCKLRAADMFPNTRWPRSVVDIDDVPSTYEAEQFRASQGPKDRLLSLRRMLAWRRRERLLSNRFDVLSVCSSEDREYLRALGVTAPIQVIPNGFERPSVEPLRTPAVPPRIGFIGLLEYLPNQEGIDWFTRECWPSIKREIPEARLRLVGKGTDGPLKPSGRDIDGLGWLADPSSEIRTWSAMVIPIRVGGGTRIKVAQGFSQKCPIVSTALGARGYGALDGVQMCVANSAEEFSRACILVIREPEKAARMAETAWSEFLEKWTWDAIRPRIQAAAEECLRLQPTRHSL